MVVYLLVFLLLLYIQPTFRGSFDATYNFELSILYLFILIYFFIQRSRTTKNWLRFDVIFLLGYTIVHFQIPFLASLGIEPIRASRIWVDKSLVNFATWMSVMAIDLWMLAYNMGARLKIRKIGDFGRTLKINYYVYDSILIIAFISFLVLVGKPFLLQGVYDGGRSWGAGANYAFLLLHTLLYLRIIYFFRDARASNILNFKRLLKRGLNFKAFLLVLVAYTFLFLRVGDRGPLLDISFTLAGLFVLFIKPIPLPRLLTFMFIGAVFFTVLKFGRGRDAADFNDKGIIDRGIENYQEQDVSNGGFTDELAGSVKQQYLALYLVPNKHPYLNGLSFYSQISGVIPFMSILNQEVLGIPPVYGASSTFLNTMEKGANYKSGDGTEVLADIYINFGIYGTFIIMFLFGGFAAYAQKKAFGGSFVFIIVFVVLLYNALYINRAMLLTPLKDIMYMLFLNMIFRKPFRSE